MIFISKKAAAVAPPAAETITVSGTQGIGSFMPDASVNRLEIIYRGISIPEASAFDFLFSYDPGVLGEYTQASLASVVEGAFDGIEFQKAGAGARVYPTIPFDTPFDMRIVWDVAGDGSNRYRFIETDTTGSGSFSDESGFGVNTTPVTAENPVGLVIFLPQETSNNFVGSFEGLQVIADGVTRLNLDPATLALVNSNLDLDGNSFTRTGPAFT